MKTKKLVSTLIVCGCVGLTSAGLLACGGNDTGEDALKAAYDKYVSAMNADGQTALSFDEWKAMIESATEKEQTPEQVDPDASLKAAYSSYASAMASANKTALSYDEWLIGIKQATADPVDPDTSLKAAYTSYASAMASANKTALSYDEWLVGIKQVTPDPVDPDTNLKAAYRSYVDAMSKAHKISVSYEEWKAGLSEISEEQTDSSTALKSAYYTYSSAMTAAGRTALTFDQWLTYIQATPVSPVAEALHSAYAEIAGESACTLDYFIDYLNSNIALGVDYAINASGQLEVTAANGDISVIALPKKYEAVCKTADGEAVANVWLQLYYYDEDNGLNVVVDYAKTDRKGIVYLNGVLSDSVNYKVKLADTVSEAACPVGYKPDLGMNEFGWSNTDVALNTDGQTVFLMQKAFNDFNLVDKIAIPYRRYMLNGDEIVTLSKDLDIEVLGGFYTYLAFEPYVTPSTTEDDQTENQKRIDDNTKAAVGIYKITVTANSTDLVMHHFVASGGYTDADENGVPVSSYAITGVAPDGADNADIYTGDNSITISLNSTQVRGTSYLGVFCPCDCIATVTVERIGTPPEPYESEVIKQCSETEKFAEDTTGAALKEVPITGAVDAVLCSDGYYRVGSENGPLLLVNLCNASDRISDYAISDIHNYNDRGTYVWQQAVTDPNDSLHTIKYQWHEFIQSYAKLCNSDGVYPVNAELKQFLDYACGKFISYASAAEGYQWLIPCMYYEPEGGLVIPGNGSATAPYRIGVGEHSFDMPATNVAYLGLYVEECGWYAISSNGTLGSQDFDRAIELDGITYVYIDSAAAPSTFLVSGDVTNVTVSVTEMEHTLEADDGSGSGTSTDNAVSINKLGVYAVITDTSVSGGEVYASFTAPDGQSGKYALRLLLGNNAKAVYDGNTYSEVVVIDAEAGASYSVVFKSAITLDGVDYPLSASFLVQVDYAKDGEGEVITPPAPTLTVSTGDNTVSADDNNTWFASPYSFTPSETGIYVFTADKNARIGVAIGDIDEGGTVLFDPNLPDPEDSGYIMLEAGVEYKVYIYSFVRNAEYNLNIVLDNEAGKENEKPVLGSGVSSALTVSIDSGATSDIEIADSVIPGEYVLTLSVDPGVESVTVIINGDSENPKILSKANSFSDKIALINPMGNSISVSHGGDAQCSVSLTLLAVLEQHVYLGDNTVIADDNYTFYTTPYTFTPAYDGVYIFTTVDKDNLGLCIGDPEHSEPLFDPNINSNIYFKAVELKGGIPVSVYIYSKKKNVEYNLNISLGTNADLDKLPELTLGKSTSITVRPVKQTELTLGSDITAGTYTVTLSVGPNYIGNTFTITVGDDTANQITLTADENGVFTATLTVTDPDTTIKITYDGLLDAAIGIMLTK